jgi:2'-5' RNA ligase
MMLRAFIALTPPTTLQHTVAEIRGVFQSLQGSWRWVTPAQIHLTLRFLGNVPEEQVSGIAQVMEQAAQGLAAFTLQAQSLGCFPHPSRPRVLWVGLTDPSQALAHLDERLTAALMPAGFPPEEHPFHPHLTLARVQNAERSNQLLPILQAYQQRDFGEFIVTQLHLFQSELQRGGALYTMVRSVTLQS